MTDNEHVGRLIVTADGKHVKQGDRVYNYYDCKWGTIERIDSHPQPNTMQGQTSSTPMEEWDNYWFTILHDEGSRTTLDGSRIATYNPKEK
jgi:hypothetical protein